MLIHGERKLPTDFLLIRNANILVPKIGMCLNKSPHDLNTFRILKHNALHSIRCKKFFSAFEIMVFADDHSGDFVEQACSRTHDARAQSAYQDEFVPVGASSSI